LKKGTNQKTTILYEKQKKNTVNELSFLLQMNYLSCENDSGSIIWMVKIVHLQQREMGFENLFFGCSCKTDDLWVAFYYKIGKLRRRTALLPPPSKAFWRDAKNESLTSLN
jgi:hypothetical protein